MAKGSKTIDMTPKERSSHWQKRANLYKETKGDLLELSKSIIKQLQDKVTQGMTLSSDDIELYSEVSGTILDCNKLKIQEKVANAQIAKINSDDQGLPILAQPTFSSQDAKDIIKLALGAKKDGS